MFGRKSNSAEEPDQAVVQQVMAEVFAELARILYLDLSRGEENVSMSALLEFDEQQRVASIKQPLVNDKLRIPSPEACETLNQISQHILLLPEKNKLATLSIEVGSDETFKADPTYR